MMFDDMEPARLLELRNAADAKLRLSAASSALASTLYKVLCHHGPKLPPGMRGDIVGVLCFAGVEMRAEDMPWACTEAGESIHIAVAKEDAL